MNFYSIIYKPFQVLSQFSFDGDKKTLKDFFDVPKDVYPVGRLDYDSEGLLILTNDKKLNHLLLNPSFNHTREYWVQVDGKATDEQLKKIASGCIISVDGKSYKTKRCNANRMIEPPIVPERNPPIRFRKNIPTSWIKMELSEGKNRQVRKMTASVGLPTLRLIRFRIEKLTIQSMNPGDMTVFTQEQIYPLLFNV